MTLEVGSRRPLSPHVVRVVALLWIVFGGLAAFGSWAFLDSFGYSTSPALIVLVAAMLGGVALLMASSFCKTPRRVIYWALVVGTMLGPPFFVFFGGFALLYFLLVRHSPLVEVLQLIFVSAAAVLWVVRDLRVMRASILRARYLELNFSEVASHVELRWKRKVGALNGTTRGSGNSRNLVVGAVAPLAAVGSVVAGLLDRVAGPAGVLLLLAALASPLCIYMLSKMVCGAYLNIYLVRQVERRTGKPVLFDEVPAE